jgi:hypothetical protein
MIKYICIIIGHADNFVHKPIQLADYLKIIIS